MTEDERSSGGWGRRARRRLRRGTPEDDTPREPPGSRLRRRQEADGLGDPDLYDPRLRPLEPGEVPVPDAWRLPTGEHPVVVLPPTPPTSRWAPERGAGVYRGQIARTHRVQVEGTPPRVAGQPVRSPATRAGDRPGDRPDDRSSGRAGSPSAPPEAARPVAITPRTLVAGRPDPLTPMVDLPRRRSLGRDDDRLRPDLDAVGLAGIGSHVARTGLARAFHDGDQPSDVPTPVDRRGAERVPGAMPPDPQDDLRVRAPSARSRTAAVPGARTAGARALPPLELATAELPAVASFEPTRRRRRRSEPRFDHGLEHRPHLDGLRGLAVVVIVLANSGIGLFRHGDIGIDVAFVVAGFLLTGVVLRDVIDGSGTGAERLVRFYARRLRSTVPILVINLIATAVLYRAIAPDGTADATRRGLRSAALFVANLFYAGAHGSGPVQGPTGQYWVVSAAGQFTFLLPWLFIGGLVWFGRWRMPMVIAAIAGASVLAALVTAAFNADRSYFSAPTRIYQFLAGALVALLIDKIRDRLPLDRVALVVPVALGTLLVLATPLVPLPAVLRGIVAVAVAAAVAIVAAGEVAPDAPGPRALAAPSAAYLGRIAYGTFLWHWILLLIVAANWSLSPWVTAAATLPVALGLAALGHELIERPLRDAEVIEDRDPIFIGVAVLTLLLVGVLIAPALAT